jgi:hypothetical protein
MLKPIVVQHGHIDRGQRVYSRSRGQWWAMRHGIYGRDGISGNAECATYKFY